jgi:hypothetical protein
MILCIIQASALKPAPYSERKDGQHPDRFYPGEDDPTYGELFMDSFLFPDPNADRSVFNAVEPWCVDKTQLIIIGFGNGLDGNCTFDLGNSDLHTVTMKHYPSICSRSSDYEPVISDMFGQSQSLSMCDVPRDYFSDASVTFNFVQGNLNGMWHSLQTGWANGENNLITAAPKKKYRLVATHMFKNSGSSIIEWLEWHMSRGVEHFFLYDNGSAEKDRTYTLPYEQKGVVTRISWPFCCEGPDNNHGQRGQMNHALYKFGQVADWIVDIDSDEFVSSSGQSIPDILTSVSPDVHIVGMQSMVMQPGCDNDFFDISGNVAYMFGSVPVATDCMPQMTTQQYPGKYFVRTLGAYRAGFVESTPHPEQLGASYMQKYSDMLHVNHFREDFVEQRSYSLMDVNDPMVQRFIDDWNHHTQVRNRNAMGVQLG